MYEDQAQPAELGASIFIKLNHILWNATERFNLPLRRPELGGDGILAIWDGDKFVYQQDEDSWYWWNIAKLFWKYGTSPYRTQKLMQSVIDKFLKLYEEPYFPFPSLSLRAQELELTHITGQTGTQFLSQNKVSYSCTFDEHLTHETRSRSCSLTTSFKQAPGSIMPPTWLTFTGLRQWYVAMIHWDSTISYGSEQVSMAPEGASQVAGGNWQIFSHMVAESGARILPNISVLGIELAKDDQTGKYQLKTAPTDSVSTPDFEDTSVFDNVVIATPFQFSGIKTGEGVLTDAIDEIPYIKLHVTLFTSPFRLSAAFFNLDAGSQVPTSVLTTLSSDDSPDSGTQGAGKAGFYSISTLKTVVHPSTGKKEFLYKIFSPEKVTAEFLSALLGVEVDEPFTENVSSESPDSVKPISWYYPHVFYSYPKELPRVTFQDPVLGPGLYYTSGIESFISTMETSALMGMNVARLIVDDASATKEKGEGQKIPHAQAEGAQKVVSKGYMTRPTVDPYIVEEL